MAAAHLLRSLRVACFAAFVLAVVSALTAASPTSAAQQCGFPQNVFDWAGTTSTNYYGVVATIENRDPQLCLDFTGSNDSLSTAYVALIGRGADDGWALMGYGRWRIYGSGPNGKFTFSQWRRKTSEQVFTKYVAPPTVNNRYEVAYTWASGSVLWMLYWPLGGSATVLDATNFDPWAGSWSGPVQAQGTTSAFHCQDDVIGSVSDAADFRDVQGEPSQGVWGNMGDLALNTPTCTRHKNKWGTFPWLFFTWTG